MTEATWRERVLSLMSQKGWNQKQLAEKSGITVSSVSRYLNGERAPRIDIIVNFSKALGVTTDYLLDGDKETNLTPYVEVSTAIARNGGKLSPEEKTKLISLLLSYEK
ncbi:MAG: helix-turn-helix transcriptional regulator [Bulleidia sp.]|nr:helix-turn-helix transcriptional regulator [Bulleidia sp.]